MLDNLLMTTLNRTISLEEVDDVSSRISQQLRFDVFGLVEESLDEDGSVSEGGFRFRYGGGEGVLKFGLFSNHSHSSSSSSERGLDDDGESMLLDKGSSELVRGDGSWGTGNDRNSNADR